MNLNKCPRCGEFHLLETAVCKSCEVKDSKDFGVITEYLISNEISLNDIKDSEVFTNIAEKTGISYMNLERYINYQNDNELKF